MNSIKSYFGKVNNWLGNTGKAAFLVTFIIGMLAHLPALSSDIPNHDGLASMYFDQNMITSGRWFLGTACGISSFYSLPWLIGVLSVFYISVTAVFLVKLLEVKDSMTAGIIGGMLVTFPSLASNFAYVFTMDGYMAGLLLAVLSVYLVSRYKLGFLFGGIALAFSMGTYQSYLPIAMLLSLYMVATIFMSESNVKEKIKNALKYLYMGAMGVGLYYVILKILLKLQGKVLDTYQGINGMASAEGAGILSTVKHIYADFVSFTLTGNVLFSNVFSLIAVIALGVSFGAALIYSAIKKGMVKSVWFYVWSLLFVLLIPLFTNIILVISPNVTYHLLMRYQYCFFGIMAVAFISKVLYENENLITLAWVSLIAGVVIIFCYAVSDNVAYSNLQKKYEKTYAYCLRLADRIEQTEGYYQGIPIYMIGVVGDDNFPDTDITASVTDHMIGISGDWLLYTPKNYQEFYKYYMGITFNFLMPDEANYYDSAEYVAMPSFPMAGSTKVVDGVLYVKTENMH